MKATSILLSVAAILLATACTSPASEAARFADEEGVSLQLAQLRHRTISDLRYELTFHIPAEKDSALLGEEILRFHLDSLYDIPLDFMDGHLILPADTLKLGENEIHLTFTAGNQSLNRRDDYLYTLFVPARAHTAFPCFDQPNMKGRFKLTLDVPADWKAVSNTYSQQEDYLAAEAIVDSPEEASHKMIHFAETDSLSTYLFAFATGHFEYQTYTDEKNGRTIGAFYRETDPNRLAQLPDIFIEVCFALDWLEDYTSIKYPFAKYDLVILPGFQFGGMEHTGATFYNDNTLFLSAHPTLNEILSRSQLITHETSHMWFGDLVTMDWFNDVWTKEVFANYFAAAITEPMYPTIDHNLNWLSTFQTSALSEDRTDGRTSIQQTLDNLNNAGLIYNNIIYCKAPIVMRKMVEIMGKDNFQRGIRKYLKKYSYANATWDDLIEILDAETSANLAAFSEAWVKQKGMPVITYNNDGTYQPTDIIDGTPTGKWQQQWKDSITPDGQILPNIDGRGYGLFTFADKKQLKGLLNIWQSTQGVTRQSLLMTLNENYLAGKLSHIEWFNTLLEGLKKETDVQTASTLTRYMSEPLLQLYYASDPQLADLESQLLYLATSHQLNAVRTQLWRLLASRATSEKVVDALYAEWNAATNPLLSINDWMTFAYELSVRRPAQSEHILNRQRERLDNPDRQRQFAFIRQSVVADDSLRDKFFEQLITDSETRRTEPWARSALYYLNHPCRQSYAVKYIYPALDVLPTIQRTGDIFFPADWCANLLSGHRSTEANAEVQRYLDKHPDLQPLLRNKILNSWRK